MIRIIVFVRLFGPPLFSETTMWRKSKQNVTIIFTMPTVTGLLLRNSIHFTLLRNLINCHIHTHDGHLVQIP